MPNRSRHTNTFDRAGNNHRMVESARMTRGTRFQDMHSESESYVYSTDGPHHTYSSSSERSISPRKRHDLTLSPTRDRDRNLGRTRRRSSHSKSRTPLQHESSNRSSHTLSPHRTLATTPSHDPYGGGNNNYHVHVSPQHHRLGSRDSHRKGSSTAYSGRQGSRGQSRNHSSSPSVHSLSRTAITSTHQTPLRSTTTVSTSNRQTPLTSNILPNENRGYSAAAAAADVDSRDASSHHSNRTGLGPQEQQQQWSPTSTNEWGDGDGVEDPEAEESVPEQIETSGQGVNDDSPGGLTTGVSYHTAQSQTTNNNPSIVSESTLYQPTRTRLSARSSKGRNRFREHIDL